MQKTRRTLITSAALAGLLAGTATAAHTSTVTNSAKASFSTLSQDTAAGSKITEKHACKGQNSCKGKGGCKGKNSCKGKGGCATDGSKPPA
jgi:hypothetical protein